jgi:hypothetical protein
VGSSWKAMAGDNRRQMPLLLKDGEKTPTEMAKSNMEMTSEMVELSDIFWDDKLTRLKEHAENKKARGR